MQIGPGVLHKQWQEDSGLRRPFPSPFDGITYLSLVLVERSGFAADNSKGLLLWVPGGHGSFGGDAL